MDIGSPVFDFAKELIKHNLVCIKCLCLADLGMIFKYLFWRLSLRQYLLS